jgi:hypothetical protein
MSRLVIGFGVASLLSVGCASQSYNARVDYVGAYRDAEAVNDAAESLKSEEVRHIPVLLNQLPEGVSFSGEQIQVAPDSPWTLIAEATAMPNGGRNYWLMGFYDYNEDESWRKGLCYWQVPLHWLTIGLWYIVPTDYACNVFESNSVSSANERKRRVISTLQRAASASGADLVVLTGERKLSVINRSSGAVISTLDWDGGSGYLFKKKPGAHVSASPVGAARPPAAAQPPAAPPAPQPESPSAPSP